MFLIPTLCRQLPAQVMSSSFAMPVLSMQQADDATVLLPDAPMPDTETLEEAGQSLLLDGPQDLDKVSSEPPLCTCV